MPTSPPPVCKYTILCDDIRREDTGKLILIGMYSPDIVVSRTPIVLKQLVFFQFMEWSTTGQFTLGGQLDLKTDDGLQKIASGVSIVEVMKPGGGGSAFGFGNLKIQQPGDYVFRTFLDGESVLLDQHQFSILIGTTKHNQVKV